MFKLPTLLIATTIAGSSLQGMNAIITNKNTSQILDKDYIIVADSSLNSNAVLQDLCKKLGIKSIEDLICPDYTLPDFSKPNNKPNGNQPDHNIPSTPIPTTTPDLDIPDSTTPEVPDTNQSISQYAKQVATLVNEERAKVGLAPLTLDVTISKAATTRSKEIQTSFSHTRPNGSSFSTVLKENGISYKGSGENIAWGQKTPKEVMKAWMNSDGHRANILNKNYTKIGVGYVQNSAGTAYWTQLFTY